MNISTAFNTTIHFIETRLQNTIGTVIKIQVARLTGWQVSKEKKKKRKNIYSNKKYLILQCLHT